jgi:hypothetical protein
MPLKYYNNPPYYDDFDETKNYVRILYRPGHAVQARELTQMQTALQAQIDRHGRHIFKEGSPVLGGNMTLDNKLDYVKVESSFIPAGGATTLITDNYYDEFIGTTVTGQSSGVTAKVIDVVPSTVDGPITLYVKYTNSGTDGETKTFEAPEEIWSDAITQRKAKIRAAIENSIGYGMRFSIDEGVFFVNGNFIYSAPESLIISRYTTDSSVRVAYEITEEIVTITEDVSLGDNALGTPNTAAPGAHRYQIQLGLTTQPFSFESERAENIIQLMLIQNGVVKEQARTEYSELANNLAQRTYEESGNYALNPFLLNIRELYNNGTNNGLYTISQLRSLFDLTTETDNQVIAYGQARLAIGLEKSVAYVHGYRIELEDIKYIPVLKARNADHEAFFNGASTVADLGNYIYVDVTQSLPDVDTFTTLNLKASTTVIGTARARSIDYVSGTTYKLYLFDVVMETGRIFSEVDNVQQTVSGAPQFLADINSTYGAKLYETFTNSLVYQLPFSTIKTLTAGDVDDTYYISKRTAYNTTVTASTSTIAVSDGVIQSFNSTDWIATDTTTGAAVSITGVSLGFNVNTGVSTATVSFTSLTSGEVNIIYPLEKNLERKTKTLITNHTMNVTAPNTISGGYDSLGLTDVFQIVSIIDRVDGVEGTIYLDVTDRYELDDGQRDNFYGIGRIRLKYGALPPVGNLEIVVDYYQHSSGDYFSVDSYSGTDYEDIPSFNSSKGLIQLRDAIDFRPTKDNTGSNFTGTGAATTDVIKAGSIIKTDLTYYVNRLDKIFVDKYGNFSAVQGVPALVPELPRDPQDAMILYELFISAFTFGPDNINAKMIDNKRYTMRDIGKLERRIKTLEYYTTLSLLEKDADNYQLPADSFKNGFLVDNFYGHNVGNPSHPDYSVSMDKSRGIVRPQFKEDEVRLRWNDLNSTGLRKTGPLLTLDYTTQPYIEQPYASYAEFINPYNIFSWTGDMKLSPESDNWKDTETRPQVIIDQEGIYDSFSQLADAAGVTGTVWNEWQTAWSGVVPGSTSQSTSNSWRGRALVSTTNTIGTTQRDQIRDGIRTEVVPDTVTTDLGDRVVEVNFVPFIRSRIVSFSAERMKPNTKLYAFFDNKDITLYTTKTDQFFEFSDIVATNPSYNSGYSFNGETSWPTYIQAREELVTDSAGTITGFFIVPNNSAMQFRTGQRLFRLTDSPTNINVDTTTSSEAIYEASGLLESKENVVLSTRVPRIDRTTVTANRTTFERGVIASQSRIIGWMDPLAQTIMIDEPGGIFATSIDLYFAAYDENIPVTVHLVTTTAGIPTMNIIPFSKVTKTLTATDISDDASVATNFEFEAPVHLQQGVEYAIVILSMSDKPKCYVSEMGGFDLTNPTYRISKQPYNGVFFKSQNASTWTPEQEKDLKFKLSRAEFSSYGEAIFNNIDLQATTLSVDPIFTTDGSSTIRVYHKNHGLFEDSYVTINGVIANDDTTMNGIEIANINKKHQITRVEKSYYEVVVTGTADATGRAGGLVVTASANKLIDVAQLSIQELVIPNTNIDWYGKLSSGQSFAGTEQPYVVSAYFPMISNQNTYFNRPQCVPSTDNATGGVPGATFKGVIETNLSNLSPVIDLDRVSLFTISNLIDHPTGTPADNRNYIADFIPETASAGGSAQSKYITRRVALLEDANQIKVIVDANRPTNTDIELYYKVQASDDADFGSQEWVLQEPDSPIGFSEDINSYNEVEYSIDDELGGVEFSSMAFKIVFKSSNSSVVPTCKNLRAIAIYG